MRSQLVKERLLEGPINGLVSDAAHGWWKERTSLLMVSSTYCPDLLCWVPGVLSYTNGASAEHFKYHFLAVIQSIAHEAGLKKHPITDELFAGVMDFSEAERVGFTSAFVEFWTLRSDDTRSLEELSAAAGQLLRGCQEHFRAAVTRVSRINGAVPPDMKEAFTKRALALLHCSNSDDFNLRANLIIRDFPPLKSWMDWWMRPSHASMLFESERMMDIKIWESIPKTTNAEEAMHWKLYSGCGRDHGFMEGMLSLYKVAEYYERLFKGSLRGVPIRYGAPEYWKTKAATLGRTKPSRAPMPEEKRRKKNDGRPPDTVKELLGHPKIKKTAKVKVTTKLDLGLRIPQPAYPWSDNSCWLDTSLQVLYMAVTRDFNEFKDVCEPLDPDLALGALYAIFRDRFYLPVDVEENLNMSTILKSQRDAFRSFLHKKKIISAINKPESAVVWLPTLARTEDRSRYSRASGYFMTLMTDLQQCGGCPESGGAHIQITTTLRREPFFQLQANHHLKFNGLISEACKERFSSGKTLSSPTTVDYGCWRRSESNLFCTGARREVRNIVVSIPVILAIEIGDESIGQEDQQHWDFPPTINPQAGAGSDSESDEFDSGIIYDLVGYILINNERSHFTARYVSPNDMGTIYTYDSMRHSGYPIIEKSAIFKTHMTGRDIVLPDGFSIWEAIYHLRGGLTAQDKFYETRIKEYQDCYGLSFSEPNLKKPSHVSFQHAGYKEMPKADWNWIARAARLTKSETAEYVSTQPPPPGHVSLADPGDGPESEEETNPLAKSLNRIDLANLIATPFMSPQALSQDSLPDSDFAVNCRCGTRGNGNIVYLQEDGEVVQCNDCKDWSHIACQRNGRASNLPKNKPFLCDSCDPVAIKQVLHGRSKKRNLKPRSKQVEHRLRPGRAALVRHGDFWYPVRVVQKEALGKWRVRWWRGCKLPVNLQLESALAGIGNEPGGLSTIELPNIVDSLWLLRAERRKIRLGKWTHPHEIRTAEDILSDPSSIPYTNEVNRALTPHIGVLQRLLTAPNSSHHETSSKVIPAKRWLQDNGKNISTSIVHHVGTLSVIERAQIANWFESHIGREQEVRTLWLGRLPIAHAHTLFIAYRMTKDSAFEALTWTDTLEKAWVAQLTGVPSILGEVDVDRDCLEQLEEEMFERTHRTGTSGNFQWGLDAGHHQDGWDPYFGVPKTWDGEIREGSDTEIEHGPEYILFRAPTPEVDMPVRPRPKPRPYNKKAIAENLKKLHD